MRKPSFQQWVRLAFVAVGVFGVVFALSGLLIALPKPAAGGTCGPGTASEAPIMAALDPVSIGAGREPPASDTKDYDQWLAFVGECQSSADGTVLAALLIMAASVGIALLGPKVVLRKRRGPNPPRPPSTDPLGTGPLGTGPLGTDLAGTAPTGTAPTGTAPTG